MRWFYTSTTYLGYKNNDFENFDFRPKLGEIGQFSNFCPVVISLACSPRTQNVTFFKLAKI
jgi:hypothetical protein